MMRNIYQITYLALIAMLVYACGGTEAASDKMAELDSLKKQKKELESKIEELEKELVASGDLKKKKKNTTLVTAINLEPKRFQHKVEVRGAVASRRNVQVSAETMGKIESILVKEGNRVKKGQILIQLDADILQNNIAEVETQLELAATVYERQSNLWEKNIGTEIQYLQAKNNKESLERRLATLKAQLKQSNVYAPFDGVVDNIPVRVGEMAQPGVPLLRLVSDSEAYISADVSEIYLGKFKEGQEVEIYFPAQDKTVTSTIASLGQVINVENRTFEVEVSLPKVDFPVRPNQVVVLNMVDYTNENALVVPTKIIQRDSQGNFVFELVKKGEATAASKVYIQPGITFRNTTEVDSGLKAGQIIANEGYRELSQGSLVTIAK